MCFTLILIRLYSYGTNNDTFVIITWECLSIQALGGRLWNFHVYRICWNILCLASVDIEELCLDDVVNWNVCLMIITNFLWKHCNYGTLDNATSEGVCNIARNVVRADGWRILQCTSVSDIDSLTQPIYRTITLATTVTARVHVHTSLLYACTANIPLVTFGICEQGLASHTPQSRGWRYWGLWLKPFGYHVFMETHSELTQDGAISTNEKINGLSRYCFVSYCWRLTIISPVVLISVCSWR